MDDDPQDDAIRQLWRLLDGKLSPEDMSAVESHLETICGGLFDDDDDDDDEPVGDKRRKTVGDEMDIKEFRRLQAAEAATGIMGMDSIGGTYRAALRQLGVNTAGLTAEAAEVAFKALKGRRSPGMATDSAAVNRRKEMFPDGDRLIRTTMRTY